MKTSLFGSIGSKDRRILVFDIGSASIGAAIIDVTSGEKPHFLYSIRQRMPFRDDLESSELLKAIIGLFNETANRVKKEGISMANTIGGREEIREAVCILSSSWYISQAKAVRVTEDKPFTITEDFIEDILKEQSEAFRKQMKDDEMLRSAERTSFIDQHLMQTLIRGYPTKDPLGEKTRDATFSLFLSMTSFALRAEVEKTIFKLFDITAIRFHALSLVSFSVIQDLFETEQQFLLIDVSGEITDISLVRRGMLGDSISFPIGHNSFIRHVTKKSGASPEETVSRIKLHYEKRDDISSSRTVSLNRALGSASEEWVGGIKTALQEIANRAAIPGTIFLTAGTQYSTWFKAAIEETDFSDIMNAEQPFHVIYLNEQQLRPCCTFEEEMPIDPFLAIEAVFVNRRLFLG